MIIGMDFGTTNSGMAVYDGQHLQLLPIDPSNSNPRVARTALYLTNDQRVTIGRAAMDTYFDDNLGRPVRMERAWVGEISVVWAEQFKWIRDVYVWVDALAPGRLFLSIKTGLRSLDYLGTVVGGFFYSLEDLIALYLFVTRQRAEKIVGHELREIVLGRPVRFAADADGDRLAQDRLISAAHKAGYGRVYLEYEPIAAAYHVEQSSDRPQNILVFDFGGGTLDFTVMRIGEPQRTHRERVLAVGGIPVAGDVFDQKLVRARLPRHFGEGSVYGPRGDEHPVPEWIYDRFADWQTIMSLQTPDTLAMLREIARTAHKPDQIKALINLASSHYSLKMFDVVELAKRALSRHDQTVIRLAGRGFAIAEPVTRAQFELLLLDDVRNVEQHLDEVVRASGLRPDQIDAVVRTGGSSQIPIFQRLLDRKFGADKVRGIDTFSSVTSGLGIIAHHIERGAIEAQVHLPQAQPEDTAHPHAPRVDLDLLKRRLLAETASDSAAPPEPVAALVLHAPDSQIVIGEVACTLLAAGRAVGWSDLGLEPPAALRGALIVDPDEAVLAITSRYRFLLFTPRQLAGLQGQGISLASIHHFEPPEEISALARWPDLLGQDRLVLLTSRGHARWYAMAPLRTAIEGPRPYRLDSPLPGVPVAVLGAGEDDILLAVDEAGRALRAEIAAISVQGSHVMNVVTGERLARGLIVRGNAEIVLLAADGSGKRFPSTWVDLAEKANARGKALLTRRVVRGAVVLLPGSQPWAVTTRGLAPLRLAEIPSESRPSQSSRQCLELAPGEEVQALLVYGV